MVSPIQDLIDMSKHYAPFLHAKLVYMDREMQDIFWNPVVEWFLSQLYNVTRNNKAWNLTRDDAPEFSQDEISKMLLYLEHREQSCKDFVRGKPVCIYDDIREALRAVQGDEVKNPFDELPRLWENPKTRKFLMVITDIVQEIQKQDTNKNKEQATTDEDREAYSLGSYPPPIGQA